MNNKYFRTLIMAVVTGTLLSACHSNPDKADAINGSDTIPKPDSSMVAPSDQVNPAAQSTGTDTLRKSDTTSSPTSMKKDEATKPLTVVIDNLGSETAPVEVSIYSPKNKFPSPKDQLKVYRFTPKGKTLTATLPGITYGEYAIAAYQDMDGDGKIATNMIGIPTDPYGFSKNYHPKIKAPSFKDCSFNYDANSNTVTFAMIRKKD